MNKIFAQKKTLILGAVYLFTAVVALIVTIIFDADWLSFIYLVLTLAGIFLNSVHVKEGLLIFSVSSAFYVYITFINKFYGEFALYIAITLYYAVFYARWKKQSAASGVDGIKSFRPFVWLVLLAIAAVFVPLYALLLKHLNAAQPAINSLLTFLTCTAVILTASRMWQQFAAWISINVVQILLWLSTLSSQNLSYLPIVIINVFLFSINIFNLITWYSSYKNQIKTNSAQAPGQISSF